MKSAIILSFIICPTLLFSQNDLLHSITGKVVNGTIIVEGVEIFDESFNSLNTTDSEGEFSISVAVGDKITFYHKSFSPFSENISPKIIQQGQMIIQVNDKINTLEEVVVNAHSNLNAESLGIIKKTPVELTTNERRLKTAGDFKPIDLLSLLGGVLPLDPIINKISGKTKRLKKLITLDDEQHLFDYIELYHTEFIATKLKIPEKDISRFIYGFINKSSSQEAIKKQHSSRLEFLMQDFALTFD